MIRKLIVLIALAGLFGVWAFSDTLFPPETMRAGQVKVRDGDTITMMGKDIRLYGIDAPEYTQICQNKAGKNWSCGEEARLKMVSIISDAEVTCEAKAEDKYGRSVATCSTPMVPDIALALVEAGLAANGVDGSDGPYAVSESLAQVEKLGVWQGEFMSPSDWRRANPRQNAENIKPNGTS